MPRVVVGHIRTAGLFRQRIASHCEGTGPGASAYVAEFTGVTLASKLGIIAQLLEDWRLAIDAAERFGAHVPRGTWKEADGKDLSRVRDEGEPFAIIQAARRGPIVSSALDGASVLCA